MCITTIQYISSEENLERNSEYVNLELIERFVTYTPDDPKGILIVRTVKYILTFLEEIEEDYFSLDEKTLFSSPYFLSNFEKKIINFFEYRLLKDISFNIEEIEKTKKDITRNIDNNPSNISRIISKDVIYRMREKQKIQSLKFNFSTEINIKVLPNESIDELKTVNKYKKKRFEDINSMYSLIDILVKDSEFSLFPENKIQKEYHNYENYVI